MCLATCDYVVELVVAEELIRSNLRVTRRIIPLGAVVGVVEHCVMLHILVFIQNLALKQAILVFFKVSATCSLRHLLFFGCGCELGVGNCVVIDFRLSDLLYFGVAESRGVFSLVEVQSWDELGCRGFN